MCKESDQSRHSTYECSSMMEADTDFTGTKQLDDTHDSHMDSTQLRSIVESTPMGLHMYKLTPEDDLVFIYANPAADATLGIDHSKFLGKRIEEAFPSIADTEIPEIYREVAKTGVSWGTESLDYEDNQIRGTFDIQAFQVSRGIMAVYFVEVTERRKIENQVSAQRDFLKGVIDSLTHPFYIIDATDYSIKMSNKAARLSFHTGLQTCYSLTHRRDIPCNGISHPCPLVEIKKTNKPVVVEHEHFTSDGQVRYHQVHGYPIFDQEGRITQMIEYNLDITDQRQAEKQLAKQSKKASLYLDILAHDVANQLQIISGCTELIKIVARLDSREQLIKQILNSVSKCKTTIQRARLTE
ncbi:MAG: PAS domain-containing protein [Candidatus Thorarchaeota archaeon]